MRDLLAIVMAAVVVGLSTAAPTAKELHVFQLATPAAPCDVVFRSTQWQNTLGYPVYVVGWRVTPLASQGAIADIQWGMTHYWGSEPDAHKTLDSGSWDHYAEPTQDQSLSVMIAPHYRTIYAGQGIAIYTRCAPMAGSPPAQSALVALIRYTTEP